MSDNYIRLIPTDKHWQPSPEGAEAATTYVAGLFSGPDDDVEEVEHRFYDHVTLIDAGVNTTRISCSHCAEDIDPQWFFDLTGDDGRLDSLDTGAPCCGTLVALESLRYDWPVGFARFEVSAMNPTRVKYELDAAELTEVASLLGHPVVQILAHY